MKINFVIPTPGNTGGLQVIYKYAEEFQKKGFQQPSVNAEIYVALNGNRSRLFVDSSVNLAAEKLGWQHYNWVLPYQKTSP